MLQIAAELGFGGVGGNEHHPNVSGLMPSQIVKASALTPRTTHCRISILGTAFHIREHLLTLAEGHAMIDCTTRGRLNTGFEHPLCFLQFPTLPVELIWQNILLFAEKGLPFAESLGNHARSVATE